MLSFEALKNLTFIYYLLLGLASSFGQKSFAQQQENKPKRFANLRYGVQTTAFGTWQPFSTENFLKSLQTPPPAFEHTYSQDMEYPYQNFKQTDSGLQFIDARSQRWKFSRADWRRFNFYIGFDLLETKRWRITQSIGLSYSQTNTYEGDLFRNTYQEPLDTTFSWWQSRIEAVEAYSKIKTVGLTYEIGTQFKFNKKWSLGAFIPLTLSAPIVRKVYIVERTYTKKDALWEKDICWFFCDPVDEYFPLHNKKAPKHEIIHETKSKYSLLFNWGFYLRPQYAISPKLNIYLQAGSIVTVNHISRKNTFVNFRPHLIGLGIEFKIS